MATARGRQGKKVGATLLSLSDRSACADLRLDQPSPRPLRGARDSPASRRSHRPPTSPPPGPAPILRRGFPIAGPGVDGTPAPSPPGITPLPQPSGGHPRAAAGQDCGPCPALPEGKPARPEQPDRSAATTGQRADRRRHPPRAPIAQPPPEASPFGRESRVGEGEAMVGLPRRCRGIETPRPCPTLRHGTVARMGGDCPGRLPSEGPGPSPDEVGRRDSLRGSAPQPKADHQVNGQFSARKRVRPACADFLRSDDPAPRRHPHGFSVSDARQSWDARLYVPKA